MWTRTAIFLLLSSFAVTLLVSFMLARRDTIDELKAFFDHRILRSAGRSIRNSRLSALRTTVLVVAVSYAVIVLDPFNAVLAFLIGVTIVLVPSAFATFRDPCPRRKYPPREFH